MPAIPWSHPGIFNLTCFLPPNTTVSIPTAHIPAGSTGPALQPATSTDWLYGQYALYEERVLLRGLVIQPVSANETLPMLALSEALYFADYAHRYGVWDALTRTLRTAPRLVKRFLVRIFTAADRTRLCGQAAAHTVGPWASWTKWTKYQPLHFDLYVKETLGAKPDALATSASLDLLPSAASAATTCSASTAVPFVVPTFVVTHHGDDLTTRELRHHAPGQGGMKSDAPLYALPTLRVPPTCSNHRERAKWETYWQTTMLGVCNTRFFVVPHSLLPPDAPYVPVVRTHDDGMASKSTSDAGTARKNSSRDWSDPDAGAVPPSMWARIRYGAVQASARDHRSDFPPRTNRRAKEPPTAAAVPSTTTPLPSILKTDHTEKASMSDGLSASLLERLFDMAFPALRDRYLQVLRNQESVASTANSSGGGGSTAPLLAGDADLVAFAFAYVGRVLPEGVTVSKEKVGELREIIADGFRHGGGKGGTKHADARARVCAVLAALELSGGEPASPEPRETTDVATSWKRPRSPHDDARPARCRRLTLAPLPKTVESESDEHEVKELIGRSLHWRQKRLREEVAKPEDHPDTKKARLLST